MRVIDERTQEEELAAMNSFSQEQRDSTSFIVIILMVLVVGLCMWYLNNRTAQIKMYGEGNPYNCQSCKNLGRACKDHRNFDKSAALSDKVYKVVSRYTIDEDELQQKYDMYGYGNEYNTDCDFCTAEKSECYSCKYDRLYIYDSISRLWESDYIKSKLCDDCWEEGHPQDEKCFEMITYEVVKDLTD